MAEFRETPYGAFNYLVSIPGIADDGALAGFSEVNGLSGETAIVEYRNGNAKTNYATKLLGVTKSGDVTLKRGVMGAQNLYEWLDQARNGDLEAKKTLEIKLVDENPSNQTPVVTWRLLNAIPQKWTGPTLTAKGGTDVAMEEMVLSVEHIEQF